MLKKIQKHNSANSIDIYRRTNHLMLLSLLTYSHWPVLHPHIGSDWKMVGIQSLRVHQVTCKQQSFLLVSTCKRCLVVHKNNNQLMIKCIHISTYIQITILPFHTVHRVRKARILRWFAIPVLYLSLYLYTSSISSVSLENSDSYTNQSGSTGAFHQQVSLQCTQSDS